MELPESLNLANMYTNNAIYCLYVYRMDFRVETASLLVLTIPYSRKVVWTSNPPPAMYVTIRNTIVPTHTHTV